AGGTVAAQTHDALGGARTVHSWTGFNDVNFARRLAAASGAVVHLHAFRGMQPGEHAVDYYARCVGLPPRFPVQTALAEDAQWLADFERRHRLRGVPLLLVHPGSGARHKNWRGFESVASYWRAHHEERVVVVSGPAEMNDAEPVLADAIQV